MKLPSMKFMAFVLLTVPFIWGIVNISVLEAHQHASKSDPSDLKTRAVYFRHFGETDKPVLPAAAGVESPSADELKSVFGEDVWAEASVFEISEEEFGNIVEAVEKAFENRESEESGLDYSFGTFRITTVEEEGTAAGTLPPEEAEPLLTSIRELTGSEGFGDWIDGVAYRIGGGGGK